MLSSGVFFGFARLKGKGLEVEVERDESELNMQSGTCVPSGPLHLGHAPDTFISVSLSLPFPFPSPFSALESEASSIRTLRLKTPPLRFLFFRDLSLTRARRNNNRK